MRAKQLAEGLEVAGLQAAYHDAVQLRERIFIELVALHEGQVGDRG